jgi:S1-C subfamily serine protease
LIYRPIKRSELTCKIFQEQHDVEFEVSLGKDRNQPLGLSLTKSAVDGNAIVSKVTPGGDADMAGVVIGCTVVRVNGSPIAKFDAIMSSLKDLPRPMTFGFLLSQLYQPLEVTITALELRTTFCINKYRQCVVSVVEEAGPGSLAGLQVGMVVMQVNSERYSSPTEYLKALVYSSRPLRLRLLRPQQLIMNTT